MKAGCQNTRTFVKGYKDDLDFTKANEVDIKTLPKDWSWYLDNQPRISQFILLAMKHLLSSV